MSGSRFPVSLFIAAMLALAGCGEPPDPKAEEPSREPQAAAGFVGGAACAECHLPEFNAWRGSHHDLAMQEAGAGTVLGDFDDAEIRIHGVDTRFFKRDGDYWVETDDATGALREFKVEYVFGVAPLQQYLIEFDRGRLQPLPIAWDVERRRWFHLYPDEHIAHTDVLHWTGREQNWNYMCAECHSTNLQKNYTLKTDSYETSWSEIDVSCEACHGPGSVHAGLALRDGPDRGGGLQLSLDDHGQARWEMNLQTGIAERKPPLMSPPKQPEACGRCHSRRGIATADYEFGKALLETHTVSLLDEGLYFADGQIDDEVYVYGSFLQSRMYRAGVSCVDCHDAHTATLKTAGRVSNVCNGCHLPAKFAAETHHKHSPETVECVDCHMTSRNYMVVDGRRDHSFRIPRPDLSEVTGAPDACTQCHSDKDSAWAASAAMAWFGAPEPEHFALAIDAGRRRAIDANDKLAAVIADESNAGIVRATALTLLQPPLPTEIADLVRQQLSNADALIRIGALRALEVLPPQAMQWAAPLLTDPVRSVRLTAVTVLSPVRNSLAPHESASFRRAEREYVETQFAIAERPEAHGNLANVFRAGGDPERAEAFYAHALKQQPLMSAVRVNLADLYRETARESAAKQTLLEGLALDANDALLHHALGLSLVREQKSAEALAALQKAVELQPDNSRYTYVYGVALNSLGQQQAAIELFYDAQRRFPADLDIGLGLVTMLSDHGQAAEARSAAQALSQRFPSDARVSALVRSLSAPR